MSTRSTQGDSCPPQDARKADPITPHTDDVMADSRSKGCARENSCKQSSYGLEDTNKAKFSKRHAEDGKVNVPHTVVSHESNITKAMSCRRHA